MHTQQRAPFTLIPAVLMVTMAITMQSWNLGQRATLPSLKTVKVLWALSFKAREIQTTLHCGRPANLESLPGILLGVKDDRDGTLNAQLWPGKFLLLLHTWYIVQIRLTKIYKLSAVLGDTIDIHSGGIDLAFPHHDNELAQAEAYYDCKQWINYFLHAGHLHVEGQKMSKSLKNFITIQEALKTYSARQLRLFFLLHQWSAKMDFKQSSMQEAIQIEGTIKNFFDYVKALGDRIRTDGSRGSNILPDGTLSHRWREAEAVLSQT